MSRFLAGVFFASALFAQFGPTEKPLPNPPPAEVDKALRERITLFYQYHVDGQFRKAEELVAEESKDFFYNHAKTRYGQFEITRIEYFDNYTRAKATVVAEQQVLMPGFGGKFKIPGLSDWKIENGKWCMFVDMDALNNSPFGKLGGGAAKPAQGAPGPASTLPPVSSLGSPDFALNKVKVDKTSFVLKRGESATATFTNSAPGVMNISVAARIPGLEVTPDGAALKAGEKASFTIKAAEGAKGGSLEFRIMPTMEVITIPVKID